MKTIPSKLTNSLRLLNLNKRQKIIISTILVTIGFVFATQTVNVVFRQYHFILLEAFLAYLLSLWSYWEGMTKLKAVVVLMLPAFFVLAATSFYFLLPIGQLAGFPIVLVFGLLIYFLLLSQNVFNVASSKAIPLYRAASTVSFLYTLITVFFLLHVIYAFKLDFYANAIAVFLISFPLALQILWSVELDRVKGAVLVYSFVVSVIMAEIATALSFWPVEPTIWALFLSTGFYIMVGILMELMRERLTKRLVMEYSGVGVVVFVICLLATSWVG
jgi:hypothetical protein